MKNFLKTILIIFVLFFIGSNLALAASADVACDKYKYPWCTDKPKDIADLVGKFYKYALAAVGVAALGAIIYGGILHTVSAGNASQQSEARAWIWGAVSGVALLLGAYLLLYIINPELVKLKDPSDFIDKYTIEKDTKEKTSGFSSGVNTLTQEYSDENHDTPEECSAAGAQYKDTGRLIGADLSGDKKRCIIRYCKINTKYVYGSGCVK